MDGKQYKQFLLQGSANQVSIADLQSGVYIGRVLSARGELIFRQKITIIR